MSRTHRLTEEVETPSSFAMAFTPAPCRRRSCAASRSLGSIRTYVRITIGRHDIDWAARPHGVAVSTRPFHGRSAGSIPAGGTVAPSPRLPLQRHGIRRHRRARRAAQSQGEAEERELVLLLRRDLLHVHDLHDLRACRRAHVGVDREEGAGHVRRHHFARDVVAADAHRAGLLAEPLGRVQVDPGGVAQVLLDVRPGLHPAGAEQHHVALAQLDALTLDGVLEVLRGDGVAGLELIDAVHPRDVEQDAARDHGRVVLRSALVPDAAAEIAVGGPAVPERPVMSDMVQRVDVRAAVRVHLDRVAAVGVGLVDLGSGAGRVVVHGSLRRVRHPGRVGRVAGADPRGHVDEVVDVQVEDVRTAQVLEDGPPALRGDPVQAADLVLRAPGTLRDLQAVLLEDGLRDQFGVRLAALHRQAPPNVGHSRGGTIDPRRASRVPYTACANPPSMRIASPVMYAARVEHRNAAAAAISSGSPARPAGTASAASRFAASRPPRRENSRSVAIWPVRSEFSVTPSAATDRAIVRNVASRPDRCALDSTISAIGSRTLDDDTATIRPQPRSRIAGSACWMSVTGPSSSIRCAASHWSRVNESGSGPAGGPPLLVMRISTGPPRRSLTPANRSGTASRSAASCTNGSAPISAAAASMRSREREDIATRAPSAASSAAIARPIPCDAPVTSATLPVRPRSMAVMLAEP